VITSVFDITNTSQNHFSTSEGIYLQCKEKFAKNTSSPIKGAGNMANIQARGTNSWFFTVSLGKGADGKYIRRTKTITIEDKALLNTKKKLQDYLDDEYAAFRQEALSGEYISPIKMTFGAFVDEWKEKYAIKHLGRATLETYLMHLNGRVIPKIGHLKLEDIKTMHLVDFMEEISNSARKDGKEGKLSAGTIHYIHRATRNVFSRAVDWKLIKSNPLDGVKKPKIETQDLDVYTQQDTDQVFTLLMKEKDLWRILITLALTTGLRRGELLGLEWKHINLDACTIDVKQTLSFTKSGYDDGSSCPLPSSLIYELIK
jgi:integrase